MSLLRNVVVPEKGTNKGENQKRTRLGKPLGDEPSSLAYFLLFFFNAHPARGLSGSSGRGNVGAKTAHLKSLG